MCYLRYVGPPLQMLASTPSNPNIVTTSHLLMTNYLGFLCSSLLILSYAISLCHWPGSTHDFQFSLVTQSCPTLWPHGPQHTRPPCPSPTPRIYPNSCPLSRWCHPTISSLCRPLLLLPSIFPSIRVFSNESALHIKWPKYWSFSFNIMTFLGAIICLWPSPSVSTSSFKKLITKYQKKASRGTQTDQGIQDSDLLPRIGSSLDPGHWGPRQLYTSNTSTRTCY